MKQRFGWFFFDMAFISLVDYVQVDIDLSEHNFRNLCSVIKERILLNPRS